MGGTMSLNVLKWQRLVRTRVIGGVAATAAAATILLVLGLDSVRGEQAKAPGNSVIFNLQPYLDHSGFVATYSENGNISQKSAFFQSLGTNGRSCATCHVVSQGFSVSVAGVRERYATSRGRDPLFASVDGANCPGAGPRDEAAHSLLLKHGLIRIGLAAPVVSPQFFVQPEYDPYGCATDTSTGQQILSFYRRPLPTTNLRFLSAVMFDGRESAALPLNDPATFNANLEADLTTQALHAVQTHAQSAADPTAAQLADIVKMELGLYTAQFWDFRAGLLSAFGAKGGPLALSRQTYAPGVNDSLTPSKFDPTIFTLFEPWTNQRGAFSAEEPARTEIAAGEQIFNSFPIHITDVRGLNDNPALGNPSTITGTCGTCHDAPGVGDHSLPLPLDIGTGHSPRYETNPQIRNALAQLNFPDLPVYRISGCTDPFTGEGTIYTTDIGKAMLTGQCTDLNRIKGPILRGLAPRAPYFHNGAAADLNQLVNFYNERFNMGLTNQQKAELVAFLNSL
jgi:cytochrome c peroxidase